MAIRRVFASIEHPDKYGYVFDSDAWETGRIDRYNLNYKFRMFETYGHGLVQHSSDWPVQPEFLTDYLFSLAELLLAEGLGNYDEERTLGDAVHYIVNDRPSEKQIAFARSIVWKEPEEGKPYLKTRYYSVKERKVTTNPEKRHDKRYQEVTRADDGSPAAIKRMLISEYADGFEHYCYASAIHEWCHAGTNADNRPWADLPAVQMNWCEDRDKARRMKDAYEAVREIVNGFQQLESARRTLKYHRERLERQAREAAVKESVESAQAMIEAHEPIS